MRRLTSNPFLQALFWLALFIAVASTMEGCNSVVQRNQETLLKTAILASTMWSNLAKQVLEDEAAGIATVEKRNYLKESDSWVAEFAQIASTGKVPRNDQIAYINSFVAKLTAWGIKGLEQ